MNGRSFEKQKAAENMAGAALILALIAFVLSCCIYASLVCAAVSITLALLSTGALRKRQPNATAAIVLSVIAIVSTVSLTAAAFYVTIRRYGSLDAFMDSYQQMLDALLQSSGITGGQ